MSDNAISKISDGQPKWNIVDVHDDDGLLHRGFIVGVVPGGLVIDFGSDIQEVVYGKIYRSRQKTFFSDNEKQPAWQYRGSLVEVLLRAGPDDPCKWYPGTLLYADSTKDHSFGLIRVYFPDRTDCLAVPGNRFRTASTDEQLKRSVIKEGKLMDRSSVAKAPRLYMFTMDKWDPMISRSTDRLFYDIYELNKMVLRGAKRWLVVTNLGERCMYVKSVMASGAETNRMKTQLGGLWRQLKGYAWFAGFLAAQLFRLSCVLLETYLRIDVYDWEETTLHCLSGTVLVEVFSCLDSLDRMRIRGVCTGWNKALTSESARVVRYTYSRKDDETYRGEYQLAVGLLNCWHEDICKEIAIAGRGKSIMSQFGQYIQDIMQEKNRAPIAKLLLYNHYMESAKRDASDNFVEDLRKTLSPLASVCSRLILKDISIMRHRDILPIVVHFKHARITFNQLESDRIADLWERLDKSCPDLGNQDRSTLAAWLRNFTDQERRKVYSQYRASDCDNLAKILTSIQSSDPRKDVRYRLQEWQPDQMAMLDPGKLTKLTTHALLALKHHDSMLIETGW